MKIKTPKVPLFTLPDKPIGSTTQSHLPLADIKEDIVLFKDGGASMVLESTALNFSLLSEKEQAAVIAAYAAWLNSLSFSIQILVRSQKKDISSYMNYLSQARNKITNNKLAAMMDSYKQFVTSTIKKKNVLGKHFYIILPFSPLELGITKSIKSLSKKKSRLPFPQSYVLKKAKLTLKPRRDHLMRQAGRLGLKLKQLTNDQLLELYYQTYNHSAPTAIPAKETGPTDPKSVNKPNPEVQTIPTQFRSVEV